MSAGTDPDLRLALVVEDEPLILFETIDQLRDLGYTVLEAGNATEALQRHDEHPELALVVTDVEMPGSMKGFALAWHLRTRDPAISIIVCSSMTRPAAGDLPRDAIFIDKPLSARVLVDALRRLGL